MCNVEIKGDVLVMNKLFKYVSGAVAGVALATVVSLTGNAIGKNIAFANPPADACIKTQNGITVNDKNANSFVRLEGACGKHTLVMKSYYAPSSTGEPHNQQVRYAIGEPKVVKSGGKNDWVKFNVAMPDSGCFYQVDLVDISNGDEGGKNPIVAAKTGGNRDCTPTPPTYRCVSMTAVQSGILSASITDYQIAAHNAVYLRTTVEWGDGASDTRYIPQGMGHTFSTAGKYTISATSYFQIVGKFGDIKEVAAAPCTFQITFTPEVPNKIQVCELATKTIITIDEKDFDATKHSKDLSKCAEAPKQIYVCEISTRNIITIREDEYGTDKYPLDKYTTDLSKCVAPPVTPPTPPTTPPKVLVNTGPGSVAVLAGATSIVAAAAHAILRRRTV